MHVTFGGAAAVMPLLERLFGRRAPAAPQNHHHLKSFKFEKDQVRVLLFRECERSGTKLLFDSSIVQRVTVSDSQKPGQKSLDRFRQNKKGKKNGQLKADNAATMSNVFEISQGIGYQCEPASADINLLSEMIFGSVAMNFKGMSLKVHILNSPQRLMCTKVFSTPSRSRCRTRTTSSNRDSVSSNVAPCQNRSINTSTLNINSISESNNHSHSTANSLGTSFNSSYHNYNGNAFSTSVDVSSTNGEDRSLGNWALNKDDSGFYCDYSSHSSMGSYCNYDSFTSTWDRDDGIDQPEDMHYFGCLSHISHENITNNIQWRLNRHLSTSLGYSTGSSRNSASNSSVPPGGSDSQFGSNSGTSTNESFSGNSNSSFGRSHVRREKLGIAILINLTENSESQMFQFLMEHAMLLESALDRLRLSVQKARHESHTFITQMYTATQETTKWLTDLLVGPRLQMPLWLELAGSPRTHITDRLADQFLHDLCFLLKNLDTKETYFFMSTLVTNVLTYHLGWVNSVSPYNAPLDYQQKELDALNRSHPYNPLWAQLGELYGAIGTPARIARTMIYGKQNTAIVERIVTVLSYFIRCGKVKRFNIDSKILSWESIDIIMENYKPENSEIAISKKNSESDFNVNGDYIEMSTFSSNDTLVALKTKNFPSDIKLTDLNKTFSTSSELNPNINENINSDMKPSLKRIKSCSSKLQNINSSGVFNNQFNISNCSESSLHSTSTLIPFCINEETSTNDLSLRSGDQYSIDTFDSCEPIEHVNCNEPESILKKGCNVNKQQISNNTFNHDVNEHKNTIKKIESHKINGYNLSPNHLKIHIEDSDKMLEMNASVVTKEDINDQNSLQGSVVFVLGENEKLVGIKDKLNTTKIPEVYTKNENCSDQNSISDSCEILELSKAKNVDCSKLNSDELPDTVCLESLKSLVQPSICCLQKSKCKHSKLKKHSGVKFEFDKYPQIVTNYMKSKNLELLDRHVIGKPGNLKIDGFEFEGSPSFIMTEDNERCVNCSLNTQMLQTPSNASELEFTSDMPSNHCFESEFQYAKEKLVLPSIIEPVDDRNELSPVIYVRKKLENTLVVNINKKETQSKQLNKFDTLIFKKSEKYNDEYNHMDMIELPMPLTTIKDDPLSNDSGYCHTLIGGVTDHYIADLVLQGTVCSDRSWEQQIKRDLVLQSRTAPGGAALLFADIDDWSVKVWGSGGGAGGMSPLIASMLDTLFHMQKAKVPSRQCLLFIESKLQELCMRSKTLAELLLDTDFCDINYLTKTLNLEPNDVPLLLAIASTHTPQVAMKYGISFR